MTLEVRDTTLDGWDLAPGVSRRDVFMMIGAAALGGVALSVAGGAPSASAAAPQTAAGVAALALSLVGTGNKLASLQANYMLEPQWHTYQGDWCAVFASWLTRGAGIPFQASSLALYNSATHVTSPAIGDIVYYPNPGHTGVVVNVVGGVAQTVEGNVPGDLYWTHTWVKNYSSPWNPVYFSRPTYSSTPGPSTGSSSLEEEHFVDSGFYIRNSVWNISWYSRVTGKRRALTSDEWVTVQAENPALPITLIPDAVFLGLPL